MAKNGTRPVRKSPLRGSELGTGSWSGEANQISDPVVGAGSLSALIVLLTSGNAARADPAEGSGAPL